MPKSLFALFLTLFISLVIVTIWFTIKTISKQHVPKEMERIKIVESKAQELCKALKQYIMKTGKLPSRENWIEEIKVFLPSDYTPYLPNPKGEMAHTFAINAVLAGTPIADLSPPLWERIVFFEVNDTNLLAADPSVALRLLEMGKGVAVVFADGHWEYITPDRRDYFLMVVKHR